MTLMTLSKEKGDEGKDGGSLLLTSEELKVSFRLFVSPLAH